MNATATTKTSLVIPSKSQKQASELRDALRIIAWKDWKSQNKDSDLEGLELYKEFDAVWKEHDIHKKELPGILDFIKNLGYERTELLSMRTEHYQARDKYKQRAAESSGYEPAF